MKNVETLAASWESWEKLLPHAVACLPLCSLCSLQLPPQLFAERRYHHTTLRGRRTHSAPRHQYRLVKEVTDSRSQYLNMFLPTHTRKRKSGLARSSEPRLLGQSYRVLRISRKSRGRGDSDHQLRSQLAEDQKLVLRLTHRQGNFASDRSGLGGSGFDVHQPPWRDFNASPQLVMCYSRATRENSIEMGQPLRARAASFVSSTRVAGVSAVLPRPQQQDPVNYSSLWCHYFGTYLY